MSEKNMLKRFAKNKIQARLLQSICWIAFKTYLWQKLIQLI